MKTIMHPCLPFNDMERVDFKVNGKKIHLAVEGSTGGTSLGLHAAADIIAAKGRVLWASSEMPDPARFSQLFEHLSLVESSRFHAMNFGGRFDKAIDAILEAMHGLPSVKFVVLDDWCDGSGRIPVNSINEVKRLAEHTPEEVGLLLISKGTVDASGSSSENILPRGKEAMTKAGFEAWTLERSQKGGQRILKREGESTELMIEDSGFNI